MMTKSIETMKKKINKKIQNKIFQIFPFKEISQSNQAFYRSTKWYIQSNVLHGSVFSESFMTRPMLAQLDPTYSQPIKVSFLPEIKNLYKFSHYSKQRIHYLFQSCCLFHVNSLSSDPNIDIFFSIHLVQLKHKKINLCSII